MNVAARGTEGDDYTERLERLSSVRWKHLLDVQRPYRWNLTRLRLGRTLDVGCGLGRNLAALPDGVGVDHNVSSIAQARRSGYAAYDTQEWPNSADAVPGSFDSMLLAHVLEHLGAEDSDQLLREYLSFLKPQATLVLICPQEKGYTTDETHVRFVSLDRMARHATDLGFTPVKQYSFPFPRAFGRVFPYNEFVLIAKRYPLR